MPKFTEGEWSLPHFADDNVKCNCVHVLADAYAGSICAISIDNGLKIADGGNDSPPLEEAKANARIIRAAPDLYKALKLALAWIPQHAVDTMEAARAALRKVEG